MLRHVRCLFRRGWTPKAAGRWVLVARLPAVLAEHLVPWVIFVGDRNPVGAIRVGLRNILSVVTMFVIPHHDPATPSRAFAMSG